MSRKIYGNQKVKRKRNNDKKTLKFSPIIRCFYLYVFCSLNDTDGHKVYGIDAR